MKDFDTMTNQNQDIILSNAKIILQNEVIQGSIVLKDGKIDAIDQGATTSRSAIDCDGDYISAGLVELHTDNLERHLQPRPGVKWPKQAAVIAHDAELASVGITTVFDALRVGSITSVATSKYDKYARNVADLISQMRTDDILRISHFLHLRAEVCSETLLDELGEFNAQDRVGIVSIMDHTPGQRQFRDTTKMQEYLVGKYGMSETEIEAHFDHLYKLRETYGTLHEEGAARIGKSFGAVLASHDDTTINDVAMSVEKGVNIAEFPTTKEAAIACADMGISVMMGAPNLLRGGSHSGNVAASELAEAGLLDIMSSDYVPSSLLMAAVKLGMKTDDMAKGLHSVTQAPAHAVGLLDRGKVEIGCRADIIRFATLDELPIVKGVWSQGQRVA